jgi:hypothetical protein
MKPLQSLSKANDSSWSFFTPRTGSSGGKVTDTCPGLICTPSGREVIRAENTSGETVHAAGRACPTYGARPGAGGFKLCLLQGLTHLPRPLVFIPLLRTQLPEPFEQPSPVDAPLACLLGWSNTLHKPERGPPLQLEKLLHIATIQHSRLSLFEGRDDGSDSTPPALHLRHFALPSWVALWRFPSILTCPGSDTGATRGGRD